MPRALWLYGGLALTALALDGASVGFDFVNWDDPLHVAANPLVVDPGSRSWGEHLTTPALGYPIPVTVLSYRANHALGGLEPWGYHLGNLTVHLLNLLGLAWLFRRAGVGPWAAAAGALVLALHPVSVEPVAWVTGRKDLLAACFALASLHALLTGRRSGRGSWLAASLLFFALGLASKPSVGAWPLVLLAVDRGVARTPWRRALGVAGAALALSVLAAWAGATGQADVQALGTDLTPAERAAHVARAGFMHLRLLVAPLDLSPKYLDGWPTELGFPWPELAVTIGAGGVLAWLALWRRTRQTGLGLGAALALAGYLPQSGIFPLVREVADSYLYLPLLGVGWMAADLASRLPTLARPARLAVGGGLGAAALLAVPLRLGALDAWRDSVALWTPVYVRYPDSPNVCRNLGHAHLYPHITPLGAAKSAQVLTHCIETLGQPAYFRTNLGIAFFFAGRLDLAEQVFRDQLDSDSEVARRWLANIAAARGGMPSRR